MLYHELTSFPILKEFSGEIRGEIKECDLGIVYNELD